MGSYIARTITSNLESKMFSGKALVILGPRQVGKTTLIQHLVASKKLPTLQLNGDEADIRQTLSSTTSSYLKGIIGQSKIVVIDEAQRIENIGLAVKLIVDNMQDVQVLVTGSSSLEISNSIKEPLTGRKYEYRLFPISFGEMVKHHGLLEEKRLLERRMVYGYYPEVVNNIGDEEERLRLLADSYLYKDILALGELKKPALLQKLLSALALQLGSEVSFNELGQLIGCDSKTVEKYIKLLEKTFVVFQLPAFSRNVRNEIRKGKKIYFYDNGIRNAVINNFSSLNARTDVAGLWENFMITERLKKSSLDKSIQRYFWRTSQQQEIDYIETEGDSIRAYEFTWNPKNNKKLPKTFLNAYPNSHAEIIHSANFVGFVSDI